MKITNILSPDADQSVTVKIGACCGSCQKKVKADPTKYFGKLQKTS